MRCLTIADALAGFGARCLFICRPHLGHMICEIQERSFEAVALPDASTGDPAGEIAGAHAHWVGANASRDAQDTVESLRDLRPDWLIVDHYGLDASWEALVRASCGRIMVIDDLADRRHTCDLLLDHGLGHCEADYMGLVSGDTRLLFGPEYAPLRPEFAKMRDASLARRRQPPLRHILISMGGVDKDNVTGRVLAALTESALPLDVELTVVMGPHAPWLDEVRALAAVMPRPVRVLAGTQQMAQFMHDADLAIGAAGTTSWERCCLGLPSVVLVLAANQKGVAATLQSAGAALVVEDLSGFSEFLSRHLGALVCPEMLSEMSKSAAQITDGHGASKIATLLVTWASGCPRETGPAAEQVSSSA